MTEQEMQDEMLKLKEKLNTYEAQNKALTDENTKIKADNASLVKSNGELFMRVYNQSTPNDDESKHEEEKTDEELDEELVKGIVKDIIGG